MPCRLTFAFMGHPLPAGLGHPHALLTAHGTTLRDAEAPGRRRPESRGPERSLCAWPPVLKAAAPAAPAAAGGPRWPEPSCGAENAPVGSNLTDGLFFLPGSNGGVPATVRGFGAVFTDVDLPDTTKIEFFNAANDLLLSSFVEPGTGAD